MTIKTIDKPIIRSKETPRQIIFEDYKSLNGELPIGGGWGYTKDDAVIIDKNDPVVPKGLPFNGVSIEYIFVEKRIYEELIIFRLLGEPYAGIRWNQIEQSLESHDGKHYDVLSYKVTAFSESDWNELKEEWESNDFFKDSPESLQVHEEKRVSKMISYKTEYWFDISSFFGMASINLDDKDNPFGINYDDIP